MELGVQGGRVVGDTPFKTSVETENNKLAEKVVELPSETTMALTTSH